jgi:sporulation protein YlmC with PRC-barrel domain
MKLNRLNLSMASVVVALSSAGLMANQALAEGNTPKGNTQSDKTMQEKMVSGQAATKQGDQKMSSALDMRASDLIGMDVHNMQGRNLGEINDLMIDVNNQRVRYAILAFGGFMGLGEKLFAYPVRVLQTSGDRLVLDVPKDRLERAPGFDRNVWPDWIDTSYRDEVDRYFGPGVSGPENLKNVRLIRASDLIDMDVNDKQGRDAGEIEDLVVNFSTGKVRYAVLDFDKAWSADDKLLPLPLNTLRLPVSTDSDAVLQVPREELKMTSGFNEDQWPDLNSAQYRQRVDQELPLYFGWIYVPAEDGRADTQTQ